MQRPIRSFVLVAIASFVWGCGGSQEPTERDIWYTQSLRPGTVEPESQAERELLARMEQVPANEPVRFAGHVFVVEPPYAAASGRLCRSIRVEGNAAVQLKLACEDGDRWVLVPDVFAEEGDAPVAVEQAP